MTEPHYVSPEVLTGNYNEKCDIWSAGVILFIMLAGYPPIHDDDKDALYQKILTYKPVTDGEEWKTVSEAAKDLIRKMLVAPDQRLDSDGVLAHPWMNNQADSFKREKTLLSINYTKLNGFMYPCACTRRHRCPSHSTFISKYFCFYRWVSSRI